MTNFSIANRPAQKSSQQSHNYDVHLPKSLPRMDRFIEIAEKVSVVAIGVFSLTVSFPLFVSAFAVGLAIGWWEGRKVAERPEETHHDHSLCAHGFIEHLTGAKLPPPLALASNVAILMAHIDHHAKVFIPIIGVSIGIRAGTAAYTAYQNFHVRIH